MSGKYYTRNRFALLFLFLLLLLLFRKPDLLTNPQLYAEDATVFFRDQFVWPRLAFFYPYNGQFHLVPRFIALAETLFPMPAYAMVCTIASLLVHVTCLSIFFLPWNRWLVQNDLLRAAVCVVMATSLEGTEMIGFSGPLMWYLFLAGILLLFRPDSGLPDSPRRRWASVAAMFVIALSAAPMMPLAPIAIWRAIKQRGDRRAVALALLAGLVVQAFALIFGARTEQHALATAGILRLGWRLATATVISWIYPGILTPLAGRDASIYISQYPSIGPGLCIVIAVAIVLTWLLTTATLQDRLRIAVGVYLTLATLASVLYTRNLLGFSEMLTCNAPILPPRYFVVAGALLVYLVCLLLQRLPLRDPRLQALCLLLVFTSGIYQNFRQPPYGNFPWSAVVPQVKEWRTAREQGKPLPMSVPIAPAPWSIYLPGE